MTGKELMIALVAAGLVGAAAGAATGLAVAPQEKPPVEAASDVADRLKAAEDALARTKTALDESHKTLADLQERVTKSEIATAKLAATPAVASTTVQPGTRVFRTGRRSGDGKVEVHSSEDLQKLVGNFDNVDFGGLGEAVNVQLGDALEGLGGELGGAGGQLAGLKNGLDLRKLPEDQRWQKAKDDLGLTWNQVEDMKKAVAARDTAMKEANSVEKKNGPNGGTITISRPDPAKLAHAQADYHDKVNSTLNDEQKKNWQSKGYDHAFGKGGFGGAMVMAADVNTERSGDAPKDANK